MATKTQRKKMELVIKLEEREDLVIDRWGHFKGNSQFFSTVFRVKMQANSWRLELKMNTHWARVTSAYYSDPLSHQRLFHMLDKVFTKVPKII